TLDAACNDIGVLGTGSELRFYVAGRAYRAGQDARSFVRAHQGDGSVLQSFGSGGQVLLDFGTNSHVDGFPRIEIGSGPDDIGRAYVASSALMPPFSPDTRSVLVTRLDALGSVDTGWGESSGVTVVPFRVPDPLGIQAAHYNQALHLSPDGLLL